MRENKGFWFPDLYFWIFIFLAILSFFLPSFILPEYRIYGLILAGLFSSIAFVISPFYFLLIYFVFFPFSYLLIDRLGFSALRFGGIFFTLISIPALLWYQRTTKMEITSLGFVIFGFVITSIISLLSILYTEIKEGYPFYGALLYLGNAVFYFLLVKFIDDFKKLKLAFYVLFIMLLVEGFLAMLEITRYMGVIRVTGTIGDPNYLGYMLLPFTLFSLSTAWETKKLGRFFYWASFLFLSTVILITFSRGITLALLFSITIFAFYKKKFWLFFSIIFVLGVITILFLPKSLLVGFSPEFLVRKRLPSLILRTYYAKTSLRMLLDYPLIGVGADNFRRMFVRYNEALPPMSQVVHNSYLEVLSGTGILGFSFFISIIFFVFKNFKKAISIFSKKDEKMKIFTEGLMFAFLAIAICANTINIQHHLLFWFFIASSRILSREAEKLTSPDKRV